MHDGHLRRGRQSYILWPKRILMGGDGCANCQSIPSLESEPPGKWGWRHIKLSYILDILGLALVS